MAIKLFGPVGKYDADGELGDWAEPCDYEFYGPESPCEGSVWEARSSGEVPMGRACDAHKAEMLADLGE